MKKNIALVSGGYSSEAIIAIQSAEQFKKNINKEKYNCYLLIINRKEWYAEFQGERYSVNKNDFSIQIGSEHIRFDCALVAIHGTPGEDGKLQGYFDMLQIPYTTCSALTSTLTFNKYFCKKYLESFGIPMAKSVLVSKYNSTEREKILSELIFPLFVKPNNGGSSFGVSKVENKENLDEAIQKALREDTEVIVEEYIKGREFTNGVYYLGGKLEVLPITEIVSPNDFFDYEAKYTGVSQEITPAKLDTQQTKKCQSLSLKIYEILQCKGVVRIDYILKDEVFYMLEINTVPGMTEESIIPKELACNGIEMSKFIDMLLEEAMQ